MNFKKGLNCKIVINEVDEMVELGGSVVNTSSDVIDLNNDHLTCNFSFQMMTLYQFYGECR